MGPDDALVLTAVREELIAAGLARHPNTDPAQAPVDARPLFIQPKKGAPSPLDAPAAGAAASVVRQYDATAMLTVESGTPLGRPAGQLYSRVPVLDLWTRATDPREAYRLAPLITARLVVLADGSSQPKRDWIMGHPTDATRQVRVIESGVFREPQPLAIPGAGPGEWTFVASYSFEVYR